MQRQEKCKILVQEDRPYFYYYFDIADTRKKNKNENIKEQKSQVAHHVHLCPLLLLVAVE